MSNDLVGFFAAIHARNFAGHGFAREVFVGQEIVLEAVYNALRQFADVFVFAVEQIVFQNGDDFVVGFAFVNEAQAANRNGLAQNVAVRNRAFAQHTNIKRVAVAFFHVVAARLCSGKFGNHIAAVGFWHEAIKRGNDVGIFLRAVNFQITR